MLISHGLQRHSTDQNTGGRRSNGRLSRSSKETLFGSHGTVDMMSKCAALIFARFGLCGVRVGEASNPGPRRELTEDDPDGVLARHALTRMIDDSSDGEPLSRPEGGKNVVRRLGGDTHSGRPVPISEGGVDPTVGDSPVPGSFNNGVVRCRPCSFSLGPTDLDSDGEVVEEDTRFEAEVKPTVMMNQCGVFQRMQADLLRWQVMRAFLSGASDRLWCLRWQRMDPLSVCQRRRALCRRICQHQKFRRGWRLLFQRAHIQKPRTFLTGQRHPISLILQTMRVQTTKKLIEPG